MSSRKNPAESPPDRFFQPRSDRVPIVAIGGSAGSIDCLKEFFSIMPDPCGLAFIVVLHLSPQHESRLPEIFERRSNLRFLHATEGQNVEADTVYIIPSGAVIRIRQGRLQVSPIQLQPGTRTVVDIFFQSLAEDGCGRVAAVILSGADSDGAAGLKRIKECGGLTVVQEPFEARHPEMPRAAIATGAVDVVLPLAKIPYRLLAYFGKALTAKRKNLA